MPLDSSGRYVIHNETPKRLVLKGEHDNVLTLAPLERTQPISETDLKEFNLQPLVQKNILRRGEEKPQRRTELVLGSALGTAVSWFVLLGTIFSIWAHYQHSEVKVGHPWVKTYWIVGSIVFGCALALSLSSLTIVKTLTRGIVKIVTITLLVIIGIIVPMLCIFLFGIEAYPSDLVFLARAQQWVFIAGASVLPGMLYFLFDRQCLATLRNRFEQAIFRLDPNVSTLTDVRAKYGHQMEEIYGPEEHRHAQKRVNPTGTLLPILAATILITLGWIMTLEPVGKLDSTNFQNLLEIFHPQDHALVFGFLGAYFFSVNDILRRYIRRDLKAKAYSSICIRILIVAILAWVISPLLARAGKLGAVALATMFVVGIFPETWVTVIREYLRTKTGKILRLMEEKGPLTDLDGVDLYDRTRLLDEGVTNIEALAHHDFVDLMIETRIPVPRLVDWADQSILQLHVRDTEERIKKGKVQEESEKGAFGLRARLHAYGIRTATDLLQVCELARKEQRLESLLQKLGGETDINSRLKVIVDALSDDEWLRCIKHWRAHDLVEEVVIDATFSPLATMAMTASG